MGQKFPAACGEISTLQLTQEKTLWWNCSRGEKPVVEQMVWQELLPMGDPRWSSLFLYSILQIHAGAVLEKLQSVARTHLGSAQQGLHPVGKIPCCSGRVRGKEKQR